MSHIKSDLLYPFVIFYEHSWKQILCHFLEFELFEVFVSVFLGFRLDNYETLVAAKLFRATPAPVAMAIATLAIATMAIAAMAAMATFPAVAVV